MNPEPHRRPLLTTGILAGTLVLLGIAKAVLLPASPFRTPSGPYAIGTVTHHGVDATRREILGPRPGGPRELMVQLWYPARTPAAPPGRHAAYLPDAEVVVPALERTFHLPAGALHSLRSMTTNAVDRPPAAADPARFPVVLLFSGLGGFRQAQTYLAEELASHGFVVVGVDQPYAAAAVAFPDGRVAEITDIQRMRLMVSRSYLPEDAPELQDAPPGNTVIPYLGGDVGFVIDELGRLDGSPDTEPLAGRLDLTRIGVAGVSLGGLVAGEAIRTEGRLGAALILDAPVPRRTVDAAVTTGLSVPTMWITRPPDTMRQERERSGGWPEEEIIAHHTTMRTTFDHLRAPGYFVQIAHVSHLDFTDAPSWSPATRWLRLTGPAGGRRAHRVIDDYAVGFFARHLKGTGAPLLDPTSPPPPDVTFEVHRAPT